MVTRALDAESGRPTGIKLGFRARRLARFVAMLDEVIAARGEARVIDLGGTADYWLALEDVWGGRPMRFTLVNLFPQTPADARFTALTGDCRRLDQLADRSFDIVHSNSVIEHVGRWADMHAFAAEARRLAPRYFVQTPSFWFPLEPHFRVPFFHWLPEPARLALVRRFACGAFPRAETIDDAQRFIEDATLLDTARFSHLFPDAVIERERVFGLTKSLIALR
jgi:hypothetical protein